MRQVLHAALAAALLAAPKAWAGRYAGEFLALGGGARGLDTQ